MTQKLRHIILGGRNCAAREAAYQTARHEGRTCPACHAVKIRAGAFCHDCGKGTTALGANLANESI